MGWSFRKSKKVGPFRVSVGKTGFSTSVGVKGARVRLNSKGRVYGSVGAMGLRAEQRLDGGGVRRATSRATNARRAAPAVTGCLSLVGLVGVATVLLVCSGALFLPASGTAPTEPTRVTGSLPTAPVSQRPAGAAADQIAVGATPSANEVAGPTLVAETPVAKRGRETSDRGPAAADDNAAEYPLGSVIPTLPPELNEEPRPWVDSTGRHSVVATLTGRDGDAVLLRYADGREKIVPLARLSSADAAYAQMQTAPRADPTAGIMLGTVVSISDGDTVELRTIDEKTKKVRLDGIDAPESGQPFGTRAKERLGAMVFQKDVRVEVSELDRYGRYLGHVYVDGRWVNRAMIQSGMAWHYREYSKDAKLAQAESLARKESIGIWSDPGGIAPWDWRRGVRSGGAAAATVAAGATGSSSATAGEQDAEERTVYVTKTGAKYHRDGCQHLRKSRIPMPYSEAAGRYSPCSRCKP